MDYSQSFSALNERLRPRVTSKEQLYSSLSRLEDRQLGSLRGRVSSRRPTVLPTEAEPEVSATTTGPEGKEEGPFNNSRLISELNLRDVGEDELVDEDGVTSPSEEKDVPGELASEETGDSSKSADGDAGSSFQRSYIDGTLPDLIRSGRPLSRRRTLGHVTDTVG